MSAPHALAVVAGGGVFPALIAKTMAARGTRIFVVHLEGASENFSGFDSITARPEQLGRIFGALKARDIKDLVLIGRMTRPRIRSLRPDLATLKLIPRILWKLAFGGDDALLRAVREMLEGQGFTLHAANSFVEGLTAPAGVFSQCQPSQAQLEDIRIGLAAARAHGARDAGQAVVVRQGQVAGYEDARGTDILIRNHAGLEGILVKTAKPQQDRALDLPSIGPETVRACAASGFAGIAVEAGATLIAEREKTIQLADQHALFLIGVK